MVGLARQRLLDQRPGAALQPGIGLPAQSISQIGADLCRQCRILAVQLQRPLQRRHCLVAFAQRQARAAQHQPAFHHLRFGLQPGFQLGQHFVHVRHLRLLGEVGRHGLGHAGGAVEGQWQRHQQGDEHHGQQLASAGGIGRGGGRVGRGQIGQRTGGELAHQRLALGRAFGQGRQLLVELLAAFTDDVLIQPGGLGRRRIDAGGAPAQQGPGHEQPDEKGCQDQQPEKEGRG